MQRCPRGWGCSEPGGAENAGEPHPAWGDAAAHSEEHTGHPSPPKWGEGSQGRPDVPRGDPRRLRKHSQVSKVQDAATSPAVRPACWMLVLGLSRDSPGPEPTPRSCFLRVFSEDPDVGPQPC